jgi:hypothetical protein
LGHCAQKPALTSLIRVFREFFAHDPAHFVRVIEASVMNANRHRRSGLSNIERDLPLIVLIAGTSDLVFVDQPRGAARGHTCMRDKSRCAASIAPSGMESTSLCNSSHVGMRPLCRKYSLDSPEI